MKTKREDIYRGVPVGGWEEVEAAVRIFDSGRVPGARDAQNETLSAMPGMGAVLMLMNEAMVESKATSPFVEKRVLKPLKERLQGVKEGSAEVDFDYDGPGVWHKTSLKVRKVGKRHSIEIWAAYVGDKPEANLASLLKIERGLVRSSVSAAFLVKTQNFEINVGSVLSALGGNVFEEGFPKNAVDVMNGFASTKSGYYPSFELFKNKDVSVSVYPDGCNRYKVMVPVPFSRGIISCEAQDDYSAEPKNGKRPFADGLVTFSVRLPSEDPDNGYPTAFDATSKKLVLDQASRIEKALQAI